jgi:pantoate--beta-alanine ligase
VIARRPAKFNAGELNVYSDPSEVAELSRALRHTGRRVMLVPTMGALHDGHLALVRAAKRVPGAVVLVSIFVNPLQFGAGEDLDAYPRLLDDDLARLRDEGVEVAFTPTVAAMYPDGPRTAVDPGPLGAELEGAARPAHFAGMLTVVLKLLQIVRPDRVFFGEKDYQQLVLVRQMVADFNIDARVVGVPTVREADGLAMSSRNRYLDPLRREAATALSAALLAEHCRHPWGRTDTPNHLGGTDVTDDAQVEDPPRYGHAGGPALRRFGDHRRGPDGCRRSARGRAGDHRRHRQRGPARNLRDHR